jgi:multiple sugar transport system ATP-binding protein
VAPVTLRGATRYYAGQERPAVDALDLEVADGEFLVLVGPSGCGKSTTLRMVAGLEGVDEGTIGIGDRDVTNLAPKNRDIAMVFQNYALYPHLTVRQNIGFHLKIRREPKALIAERIAEAAQLLGLTEQLDRKPAQLSGGQRQRVAMGRAIVRRPQVFLLDEPLSNLDAKLRVQTRTQIAALQREFAVTTIYVTHDQVEAMTMGDRVAVMNDGLLQQCATPPEIFARPVNLFVASFIGSPAINLLPATVADGTARAPGFELRLTRTQAASLTGADVVVGLRPEAWTVAEPGAGIDATIEVVEELGSDQYIYCSTGDGEPVVADAPPGVPAADTGLPRPLTVRTQGMAPYTRGQRVGLRPHEPAAHLFDAATGLRLED